MHLPQGARKAEGSVQRVVCDEQKHLPGQVEQSGAYKSTGGANRKLCEWMEVHSSTTGRALRTNAPE
eukprot:4177314-Prymnesium_polylepis.1